MALKFCSLASGSSGNSYLIFTEKTKVLLDAGLTGKYIIQGLGECGLQVEELDAIFLTHEHSDHVKSVSVIQKKSQGATVYASKGTIHAILGSRLPSAWAHEAKIISHGQGNIAVGDISVTPFRLSHDAREPLGYTFEHKGRRISVVTDTGFISEEIFREIKEADLLVLEANHEKNMLLYGPYPYNLKMRILGEEGHISNEDAANCLARVIYERENSRPPMVAFAHLSGENNTPEMVKLTVENILFDSGYIRGKDYEMNILSRDEISPIFHL